jgi:RNA polymerase sigma-54 factor
VSLSQQLSTQLSQKLALSQEMLVSLELIQLPLVELRDRIQTEILENPALEINEKKLKNSERDIDKLENAFNEEPSYFEDSSSAEIRVSRTGGTEDLKRKYLEGVVASSHTLQDHLIEQLDVHPLSDRQKEIARTLITLIDDNGFLTHSLEELYEGDEVGVAVDILELIQMLDPPGIAQRDMQGALLFQLESLPETRINSLALDMLRKHFDLLMKRKDKDLATKLRATPAEMEAVLEHLAQCNPFPGRVYSSAKTRYVIPDARVLKKDGELEIKLNEEIIPELTVNNYMKSVAAKFKYKKKTNDEEKYVSENIQKARRFISTLKHRKKSLFRLLVAVVHKQRDFFLKGPKFIKPLTMKQVAEELDLAESTISRLASSKYIQTEYGVHDFKYFFTNALPATGGDKSAESIREMIKEILENEDSGKHISDQKIADMLEKRGVKIARRTVAKYRKLLNILPSHERKFMK